MTATLFGAFLCGFFDGDGVDDDGFDGHIHVASLDSRDFIHDVEAFGDFTKDGVVAVEMRGAAYSLVSLTLGGAEDLA